MSKSQSAARNQGSSWLTRDQMRFLLAVIGKYFNPV